MGEIVISVDPQGPDGAFLLRPLKAAGLPAVERILPAGDLAFTGKGANNTELDIGVEFKRLDSSSTDLLQSLRSGRLSGEQLPKMLGPKGHFHHAWLLVEGQWRQDPSSGLITIYKGRQGWKVAPGKWSAMEMEKRLLTLEMCGGMHVRFTNTRADSIRFISALYRWWTDVALDRHTSHLATHDVPTFRAISDVADALRKWPGVGLKAAIAAERTFNGSIRNAATATPAEWANMEIAGKRFGHAKADKLETWLKGESND